VAPPPSKISHVFQFSGWEAGSYGYHADDGFTYFQSGTGTPYGPTFSTGDVIGCCINFAENLAFFTRNGASLGVAFRGLNLSAPIYPLVGLRTLGETVEANFGQSPFLFDIASYTQVSVLLSLFLRPSQPHPSFLIDSQELKVKFLSNVKASEIPPGGTPINAVNDLVRSYLIHSGYTETARIFSHASGRQEETDDMQLDEDISHQLLSIKNRKGVLCSLSLFNPILTHPPRPFPSNMRIHTGRGYYEIAAAHPITLPLCPDHQPLTPLSPAVSALSRGGSELRQSHGFRCHSLATLASGGNGGRPAAPK